MIASNSAVCAGLSDLCLKLLPVGSRDDVSSSVASSEEAFFKDIMIHTTNTIAEQRGGQEECTRLSPNQVVRFVVPTQHSI